MSFDATPIANLTRSLRRPMWDQVALHDKLKRAISSHIDGVSLLALHGSEDRDNSTVVGFVLIDEVTDGKFWHQTFYLTNRVSGRLDQQTVRSARRPIRAIGAE